MRKMTSCLMTILFFSATALAQTVITGRVLDRNNQPIEGAAVTEKGSSNGSLTDKDGNYSLKVSTGAVLLFSGTGVTQQEVTVNGSTVDVTLVPSSINMGVISVVGSRSLRRSATETPVPIDIIPVSKIANTLGQVDLNQILQYVAPSFNSNRQSGADGADHVDPATLRGLGPDQTLVLVNGKRWHQSSLVNLFGSRGRGNTGTDLNTIPAAAIERIEILRDGAAAQYGSDAIAGVVNVVLRSATGQGAINISKGKFFTGYGRSLNSDKGKILDKQHDGNTANYNINYGLKLFKGSFFNITGDYLRKRKTYRPNFEALYPDNFRKKFGDGSIENFSLYLNTGFRINERTSLYAFGGTNYREGSAYAYTRDAASERNVTAIYPNGFDPLIQPKVSDVGISAGLRTTHRGWNTDIYVTAGRNRFLYYIDNTLNSSMEKASPTHFYSGGFQLAQNTIGINTTKAFDKVAQGFNLAVGGEFRSDRYKLFAGEENSYKQYGPVIFSIDGTDTTYRPGGSQGFPGFQPKDEADKKRTNVAAYIDAELDVTKRFLVSGAIRVENYSDFGLTSNFKMASRYKFSNNFLLRGSVSTGFRAPSLPQIHFSSTFTNVAQGKIYEILIAPNSGPIAKAAGIPELKEETSLNASLGFTAKPNRDLSITVDGYYVSIKDRIVLTGLFYDDDNVIGPALQSLNVGAAQFFTNAVDTKTIGLDIIASYNARLGRSRLVTTFAGNFNDMRLQDIHTTAALAGKEDIYYGKREQYFLLASAPAHKLSLSFDHRFNSFSSNLRFTHFAKVKIVDFADQVETFRSKMTTDLSFSVNCNKLTFTLGASNIFDVYPDHHDAANTETGGMWESVQMGIGGASFFGKLGIRL